MPADPVILHALDSLNCGGTERTLIALLRAFDEHAGCLEHGTQPDGHPSSEGAVATPDVQRIEHRVALLRDGGEPARQLPDSVACLSLGTRHRHRTAGVRLGIVARRWRARVLHARGVGCWWDALAARMLNPKMRLVLGYHGTTALTGFAGRHRAVARTALHWGARFATVSLSGVERLHGELGVPRDRIDLLQNGVRAERFVVDPGERVARRRALGWTDAHFVLGCVGTLSGIKRHDLLVRVAARVKPQLGSLRVLVVGDGPERSALECMAREAGLAEVIHFAGHRDDIAGMLACMDGYVCCSDAECMSNAVLEAMAAGLPIVATDVGDNARLLRRGVDGLVVPPGCEAELAEAVAALAQDPALRSRLRDAAAARVAAFDFRRTVDAYRRFYASLGSRPLPGRGVGICTDPYPSTSGLPLGPPGV